MGDITINITNGKAPYLVETIPDCGTSWNFGSAEVKVLHDVPCGDYAVKVTDANGCEVVVGGIVFECTTTTTDEFGGRFAITVDTTKAGSANDTFVLPGHPSGTYDYYVDWGDGGAEEHIVTAGDQTHVYAVSGTYQIMIRGTFPRIYFNNGGDKLKLISIDNWGDIEWTSMESAFSGCANMVGTYADSPDLSAVLNVSRMFQNCSLFNQSVSNFDTAAVTDMSYMFLNCTVFNQSVSNFDTAAVTTMAYMFYNCSAFDQSVSNFDTAAVTTMAYMFSNCSLFNQSVSNFDTAAVTDMQYMFSGCTAFNQSVSNFNTAAVTNMYAMFLNCTSFKQSLATFDMTSVTDVTNLCSGCDINETGTTTNYDATLIAWELQDLINSKSVHFGTSKYSDTGQTAKNAIIADDLWSFTDGGQIETTTTTTTTV